MRMKLDTATKSDIVLGIQTNVGGVESNKLWKIKRWAPKRAKSYRITEFYHTDYHGERCEYETGYATVVVEYFTTLKEGSPLSEIPDELPPAPKMSYEELADYLMAKFPDHFKMQLQF